MNIARPVYGQEALSDYPGPQGLIRQLDQGIPIAHQPAKVRKALAQLDEHEAAFKKALREAQAHVTSAERALVEIHKNRKQLRRLL